MKIKLLRIAAIFCLILAARVSILTHPPLPEQARGLWFAAFFLENTNFDIASLCTLEPDEILGGANAYPNSILPWIVAVIIRLTPTPTASFVAYRLLTFLCAAITGSAIYEILREKVPPLIAGLAVAATMTVPVYSTQIDLLGMDIPMIMFVMLSCAAIVKQKFAQFILFAACAAVIKVSAILFTLSLVAVIAMKAIKAVWTKTPLEPFVRRTGAAVGWAILTQITLALFVDRLFFFVNFVRGK